MNTLFFNLSQLGWGWVTTFAFADAIAIAALVVQLRTEKRTVARRACIAAFVATGACIALTAMTQIVGYTSSFDAVQGGSSAAGAHQLASGIAVVMIGMTVGKTCTTIAGVAALTTLLGLVRFRRTSHPAAEAKE